MNKKIPVWIWMQSQKVIKDRVSWMCVKGPKSHLCFVADCFNTMTSGSFINIVVFCTLLISAFFQLYFFLIEIYVLNKKRMQFTIPDFFIRLTCFNAVYLNLDYANHFLFDCCKELCWSFRKKRLVVLIHGTFHFGVGFCIFSFYLFYLVNT